MSRRLRAHLLVPIALLAAAPRFAGAATRLVPAPYPTIQAAIAASAPSGDTVLVAPGTYVENVDFMRKDVVLESRDGPETTIIDGSQPADPGRGCTIYLFDVGAGGVVRGLTITRGTGASSSYSQVSGLSGGGVCIVDSRDEGSLIEGNWITGNTAHFGAGIYQGDAGRIIRNRIFDNTASDQAGGIQSVSDGSPTSDRRRIISENEIYSNHAANWEGGGGLGSNCRVSRNVVACNEAERGAAGLTVWVESVETTVEGNTIVANYSPQGVAGVNLIVRTLGALIFRANLVAGDFCLQPGSPLLPESSPPGCGLIGARGLCPEIGVGEVAPSRGAPALLVARPNPFADRTTIDVEAAGSTHLLIVAADGTPVVELAPERGAAGRRFVWDGRDARGRRCPAGIYFARALDGRGEITGRLLLLR